MEHPGFFARAEPLEIGRLAGAVGAVVPDSYDATRLVTDIRTLADAGPAHASFLDNRKYLPQLALTAAGAVFVHPNCADRVPALTVPMVTKAPYHAFAKALAVFYPDAMRPQIGRAATSLIDPSAEIEPNVVIEPGAFVGPEAKIGRGSRIAAGAVIGYRVTVGRETFIGPTAVVSHALIGDRVIIHAGVKIGQDGFGFAMGPGGHLKVPQIGRVIVQDDVEIGANTTIDRGALKDTVIGEGSKIDNLVQIGHNAVIGRHCVLVSGVGISGSTELGDFVVMGGQAGAVGHVRIGNGVQVAGSAHVVDDVPAGSKVGGTPAVPFREYARQIAHIKRLGRTSGRSAGGSGRGEPGAGD
jgi:UDP-3-O-[3-hydroxymyristoyl] glucosamine N-acyltransferase